MPRTLRITVPSVSTDRIVDVLESHSGVLSIELQKHGSLKPPGDVITVRILNRELHVLLSELKRLDVAQEEGSGISTAEIASVVAPAMNHDITKDSAEATWEEMEMMIAREGNMTLNGMLLMAVAGVIASVGLLTSVLHLVVAAMAIAPGFEPIARVSLSLACGSGSWRRGFIDTGKGYISLLAGAFIGTALVRLFQGSEPSSSYHPAGVLLEYWSSITATSLLASAAAGAAGGVLIATNRSILTAGVMIALALIPTPAVIAIGVLDGDFDLAGQGFLRWIIEVAIVLVFTLLVFAWKRVNVQKRTIWW